MTMAAGRMDRRLTLQTFTEAADGEGSVIKTWADLSSAATMWARVEPMAGRELTASGQVVGEADTLFTLRYRSDLSVEMRISYAGDFYDIQSLVEVGRREGIEVLAKKVAT